MKITKNFLVLICMTPLLLTAMEESTPQEKVKLLQALHLDLPKDQTLRAFSSSLSDWKKYPNNKQQAFDRLINIFCITKSDANNFLEELRDEQDYVTEEFNNLKTAEDLFYLNQEAKNLSLQAQEEALQTREKKLKQTIAQAVNQGKDETKELMQERIDQLAQTYDDSLRSIKEASDKQYERDYKDIESIIESKYKTNLSQQQDTINKYAKEIKKLQEEKETAYQDFEQKGREGFDNAYETLKKKLEEDYKNKENTLSNAYTVDIEALKNQIGNLEDQKSDLEAKKNMYFNQLSAAPDKQLSFMQRHPFVPFGLGLFLGGLAMLHKGNITKLFTRDS